MAFNGLSVEKELLRELSSLIETRARRRHDSECTHFNAEVMGACVHNEVQSLVIALNALMDGRPTVKQFRMR